MEKTETKLWACSDCIQVIANGDEAILEYDNPEFAEKRFEQIERGLAKLNGKVVFTRERKEVGGSCDCCQTVRDGERWSFTLQS